MPEVVGDLEANAFETHRAVAAPLAAPAEGPEDLDDILGGFLEFLDFDVGGSSLMPILLAFVAMFGIGGLFGTQVLGLSNAAAAVVGVVSGERPATFLGWAQA